MVDATAGHELMSFMDAYSRYNQIFMDPEDSEKTAFRTDRGIYCYKTMPFGLKNTGTTYQRLVNKIFEDQIGKSMEVYMDDMLTKSLRAEDHVTDLKRTFNTMDKYRMKLNLAKCVFGVGPGKFLGFVVNQRGIEANPEKIKALLEMKTPETIKDVQRLTRRVAALNRFVSIAIDKCLLFFKFLRKAFKWDEECDKAFEKLKAYLEFLLLLSRPLQSVL